MKQYVPRVHFLYGAHYCHARFMVAVEQCPLYGRRSPVFGQKRSVHVEHAERKQGKEFFGENLPERRGHSEVGRERRNLAESVAGNFFVLQHGNAELRRPDFEGGRTKRVSSAHGLVGTGHGRDDVVLRRKV